MSFSTMASPPHMRSGKAKGAELGQDKRYGKLPLGSPATQPVVERLAGKHAAVVERTQQTAGKAEEHHGGVVGVRKVCRKGEANDRPDAKDLRDQEVRRTQKTITAEIMVVL